MNEWVDTTGLEVIDSHENTVWKVTYYAIHCLNSENGFIDKNSMVSEKAFDLGHKKQRVFAVDCGCKMIAELVNKVVKA